MTVSRIPQPNDCLTISFVTVTKILSMCVISYVCQRFNKDCTWWWWWWWWWWWRKGVPITMCT